MAVLLEMLDFSKGCLDSPEMAADALLIEKRKVAQDVHKGLVIGYLYHLLRYHHPILDHIVYLMPSLP